MILLRTGSQSTHLKVLQSNTLQRFANPVTSDHRDVALPLHFGGGYQVEIIEYSMKKSLAPTKMIRKVYTTQMSNRTLRYSGTLNKSEHFSIC